MTTLTNSQIWYREVYLKSEHWRNLRNQALQAYGRFCAKCRAVSSLDVHHLRYRNIYDVLVTDLQVLCRPCHEKEHKKVPVIVLKNLPKEIADQIHRYISNGKPSGKNGRRNQAINRVIKQKSKDGTLDLELKMKLLCARTGANSRRYKSLLAMGYTAEQIFNLSKKKLRALSSKYKK